MKACSKCKEVKSLAQFSLQKKGGDSTGHHYTCKTCVSLQDKLRYAKNREQYVQRTKDYRLNNPEKLLETQRNSWAKRQKSLVNRLRHSLRSSIRYAYRSKSLKKKKTSSEILGCTYEQFTNHIESQFEAWMNESNYGKCIPGQVYVGWDIDHIVPLAIATTEEELLELCHYKNLRPVCSHYNRYVKRDRLE